MRWWILILQWLLVELVTSQAAMLGTHFLLQFPFMPEGRPLLMAYSLQPEEITVTLSAPRLPGFRATELLVTNLAVETYAVPRVMMMGHASRGSALQARSSAKFGVTVYLPVSKTSGAAFPAIPVSSFGNAYTLLFTTVRPYLCFLASTDLTSVELQADRTVPALKAMLPTGQADILLQKGEARTILNCKYVDDVVSSIAVMRVKSNRAIGVITGNCEVMPKLKVCQVVGRKVAERISGDMILSDNSAGKHFLVPMLDKHVCCVYFLSLSGKVTTLKIQTNQAVTSLYIPARRYINLTADQVVGKWINASLPVVCYMEFTSTYHGVQERYGLSMIVPVELFTSMYVWSTVTIKHQELHHYFAVVSPRDNFYLNVDGVVPKLPWRTVEGARWQAATQKVTPGTHTAYSVNPANFGLYVYGVSATVMFPHYAGFVFTNLYGPCQKTRPQLNDKVDNDCDGFVDEENKDSKDNDGDGLVDEDNGQVPSTFKSLKQGPATYKMEIVFPKSYPDDCPCPNPANCNIELCRGRVNYIRCLEDLLSHPTCKTGSYMEAKQKLATVSKVDIRRVCTGKCPSSLRDCYPIKDMTSDMKSDLSCDQVINFLTCFDSFVNNPACSAYVRNEATRQASEVTTLGQTYQCEGIAVSSGNAAPMLRQNPQFAGETRPANRDRTPRPGRPMLRHSAEFANATQAIDESSMPSMSTSVPRPTAVPQVTLETTPDPVGTRPRLDPQETCLGDGTLQYCVQEADFTCTKKSRYHRCLTDIIKNPSCPDKLREEAKSFRDSTLKSRCKGGWDTINPDKLVTDDYDEDKNMDSCKEARTLCLKEANTTISCEKLKERHKCALGYKDTPYCSEGVRKDAEEWIEKHAIEDCAANDASLSEPCVEVPPSCQNNETNNATECEFYQPIVNCEMNRLTKIWCDKEKWFADVAKAISNDEAAEKSNCYGELPDHPNIALKLLQVNPVDSNSLAFGLSTVFLTYQVDLNALDKEPGCYHLYFDYCKASWTDCYKFESWLTACVFPSDCHMLTCSKDEAVVTDATNVMCNCINLANQMKAILSIPTATYDAIDYKFRLRVSSSKDPGEKEAVVEISEIFKMSYYIDENFAKLPFLSKNVGAKTKLGLCGVLQISALVAFTLATTFNW